MKESSDTIESLLDLCVIGDDEYELGDCTDEL